MARTRPGEVFVVAMLAAKIGEIDVRRHVRGLLRRSPVSEIVGNPAVSKINGSVGFQVAIHLSQLVSRRRPALPACSPAAVTPSTMAVPVL